VAPRRARISVSIVFLVCGAAFATWAARVLFLAPSLRLCPVAAHRT
jgi:hypothetical protein